MPSPSQRIAKASAESAEAERRLAAAEKKIAQTFIEMLRDDEDEPETAPPLPSKNALPKKNDPPQK